MKFYRTPPDVYNYFSCISIRIPVSGSDAPYGSIFKHYIRKLASYLHDYVIENYTTHDYVIENVDLISSS